MNSVEEPVNRLTSSYTDKATHTPAYKETSVRLTVLSPVKPETRSHAATRAMERPLRNGEWRSKRKWARADYREPGQNLVQIEGNLLQ